jgi:hypothetical protein
MLILSWSTFVVGAHSLQPNPPTSLRAQNRRVFTVAACSNELTRIFGCLSTHVPAVGALYAVTSGSPATGPAPRETMAPLARFTGERIVRTTGRKAPKRKRQCRI